MMPGYRSDDGSVVIVHRDGVPWWDAPVPKRWHRCTPQTTGVTDYVTLIDRCACGAIRLDGRVWIQRNSRREK